MDEIQKHKNNSQIRNLKCRDIQREAIGYIANIYFLTTDFDGVIWTNLPENWEIKENRYNNN